MSSSRPLRAPAGLAMWDALVVGAVALVLRLVFMAFSANTYDYDEFVLLQLAREVAGGALPYHDFMFFHPPGALLLLRALEPLTSWWWPAGRVLLALADSVTAVFVWMAGATIWDRRAALASGLLYSAMPLTLVSATRVGQDPLITIVGFGGLLLLLRQPSVLAGATAGVLLGLAVWTKYPALYFLPIYLL
ncbi:MAG TPA: hypothetical protein VKX16_17450, partial [Chloroflexota bacterium]|nr:hypothetical protein [Chloroflexota bacterium]